MPGDLAWRLPGSGAKDNLRLFYDNAGLAGFAWFEPDTGFEFDLRHDLDIESARSIVDWAEQRRMEFPPAYPRFIDLESMSDWEQEINSPQGSADVDRHYFTTVAHESDEERVAWLHSVGYQTTGHFAPQYRWNLNNEIDDPALDARWTLRSVTNRDLAARVELHRAAWLKSSFSLQRYQQIRSSPSFDASLDVILDTGDNLVSYCICWADPISNIGIFEPVGTRPEWRGKGVGRAVILEGLRRMKQAGMKYAQVNTAGFNAPAQALYESCGFTRIDTARTFIKALD
jgi:ribosomal protein S18 acetylase RimI-like enzyme